MTLRGLGRRLDRLEAALHVEDPRQLELMALEAANLTDEELEALLEASTLEECGHSEDEIVFMMGSEKWAVVVEATKKVNLELKQIKA